MGRILALALLLAAGGWSCEDEGLAQIRPSLQATPSEIDFGTVALGQEAVRVLEVENTGAAQAVLGPVRVESECGCFFVREPVEGRRIAPAAVSSVEVVFRALQLEPVEGEIRFTEADPSVAPAVVQVRGSGRDDRLPGIQVEPEVLDFGGVVPIGGTAVDRFVIRSVGTADLLVDRIAIEPERAPFRITTSTPTPASGPGRLAPGAQVEFSVRARVADDGTDLRTARVLIDTNILTAVDVPEIPGRAVLPITTRGNRPPVAVIEASEPLRPFTRIDLDGTASFDQDEPPDTPLRYGWELLGAPEGSQARLQSLTASTTAFFADLSGPYTVALQVTDAIGTTDRQVRVLDVTPDEGIRFELFWDHPDADLDLHVIRDGGAFCDCGTGMAGEPTDVHYRCRNADWYPGLPGANPIQDVDDRRGFGPEVTFLPNAEVIPPDRFLVAVHYFNDRSETSDFPTQTANATVRVFFSGLLVAEFDQALTADGQLWEVAAVDWPSGQVQVSGAVVEDVGCGFF